MRRNFKVCMLGKLQIIQNKNLKNLLQKFMFSNSQDDKYLVQNI